MSIEGAGREYGGKKFETPKPVQPPITNCQCNVCKADREKATTKEK